MPAGEVKGLVGHSQSMDTFGIYGHALQGEDAATAGKLGALFESLAAPAQEQGEGEAYKKPAKRFAQQVGNIKKWPKKAAEMQKCVKKCVTGKKKNRLNPVFKRLFVVGANGLEPLTPCTSSRCSSQLS